jgi:hypothetical protein
MGHSMGGIGTWKLAPKYPDLWPPLRRSQDPAHRRRWNASKACRIRRARRQRSDSQRAGIADDGREDEGLGLK